MYRIEYGARTTSFNFCACVGVCVCDFSVLAFEYYIARTLADAHTHKQSRTCRIIRRYRNKMIITLDTWSKREKAKPTTATAKWLCIFVSTLLPDCFCIHHYTETYSGMRVTHATKRQTVFLLLCSCVCVYLYI